MALQPGTKAPNFTIDSHLGQVNLSELRGKNVVVGFHPASFTGGWLNQVREFRVNYDKFVALNAEIVQISGDQLPVQVAWVTSMAEEGEDEGNVPFPVASDFWPHGDVTRAFDVFNEATGRAKRAVFIVDPEGVIRWSNVYTESLPASSELLYELEQM